MESVTWCVTSDEALDHRIASTYTA